MCTVNYRLICNYVWGTLTIHLRSIKSSLPFSLPLFCTASDAKLGRAWERGYKFRCPAGQYKQMQWAAHSMKSSLCAFSWSLWLKSQNLSNWNFFVSPHLLLLLIVAHDYNYLKIFLESGVFYIQVSWWSTPCWGEPENKPYTSGTALCRCVCIWPYLAWPYTINFKCAFKYFPKIECPHALSR